MSQRQKFKTIEGDETLADEFLRVVGENFNTYTGFSYENLANSSLSWDDSTRTLTLAPVSGSTSVYVYGSLVTISTPKTVVIPATSGTYYVFIDNLGVLSYSTSKFITGSYCLIGHVLVNTTCTPVGIVFDERRLLNMDVATYKRLYLIDGAIAVPSSQAFVLSGYTLNPATPTDALNTFAVSTGDIVYQDRTFSISPFLPDNGPYAILYIGSDGFIAWDTTAVVPYKYGATYVQRCAVDSVTGFGTLTEIASGAFVNYYMAATNAIDSSFRIVLFMGQVSQTSTINAANELMVTLNFRNLPSQQFAWLYKITYGANSTYTTASGRCRVTATTNNMAIRQQGQAVTLVNHAALSDLSAASSHPATAINMSPILSTGVLNGASTVQAALTAINNYAAPVFSDGTYTPTYTASVNLGTVTHSKAYYNRIGNQVHVRGLVNVSASAGSGDMYITLPIAPATSPWAGAREVIGIAFDAGDTRQYFIANVANDPGGQRAYVSMGAIRAGMNGVLYEFTYSVL